MKTSSIWSRDSSPSILRRPNLEMEYVAYRPMCGTCPNGRLLRGLAGVQSTRRIAYAEVNALDTDASPVPCEGLMAFITMPLPT